MKKRWMWILELLIWLILLTLIIGMFFYIHTIHIVNKNSYHLFFRDIDGLIKGSPVRMLGMQIGYITDMQILDNEDVYVTFLVTQKGLKLPSDCIATVEFFGMAGSKSLEIYPPKTIIKKEHSIITTKEPIRLKTAFEIQSDIATMIFTMTSNLSTKIDPKDIQYYRNLMKQSGEIKNYNEKLHKFNDFEENMIKRIDKRQKQKDTKK